MRQADQLPVAVFLNAWIPLCLVAFLPHFFPSLLRSISRTSCTSVMSLKASLGTRKNERGSKYK